jgi:hypothetical protein
VANTIPGDEPRTIRTPEKEAAFLEALAATCNVTEACRLACIGRMSVYDWRHEDASFAAKWKKALSIGAEVLEDEAVRRATVGVDKPVYQGGQLVGTIREYSDTLLIFLMKGAKPKRYRDNMRIQTEDLTYCKLVKSMSLDEMRAFVTEGTIPASLKATFVMHSEEDENGD